MASKCCWKWTAVAWAVVLGTSFAMAQGRPAPRPPPTPKPVERILRDFKADPAFKDLPVERWQFSYQFEKPEARRKFRELMSTRLPGSAPRLALFLDPILFAETIKRMRAVWSGAVLELPAASLLVDAFLDANRGQTLVVVGHVENGRMVMLGPTRGRIESIPIADLIERAAQKGVLVVAVGCDTYRRGVPFGFSTVIGTGPLPRFAAEASKAGTILQIFAAMQEVGQIAVDIDTSLSLIRTVARNAFEDFEMTIELTVEPLRAGPSLGAEGIPRPFENRPAGLSPDIPIALGVTALLWIGRWSVDQMAQSQWFLRRRERVRWLPVLTGAERILRGLRNIATTIVGFFAGLVLVTLAPWLAIGAVILYSIYSKLQEKEGT